MASSSSLLTEEQFQCPICLSVFTDPVSTPCGHNFCMTCLNKFWASSQNCLCPICKKEFPQRPELCVNTFIAELVLQFKDLVHVSSSRCLKEGPSKPECVPCDVCTDSEGYAVKSCLDCGMSFCDAHLEHHRIAAKLRKHKLINAVKNLEDFICQIHQRAVELFCKNDQMFVCQFCMEGEHKTHNTVHIEEESGQRKVQMEVTQTHIQQMIQDRMKKIGDIKNDVELKKINTDKGKAESIEVFNALIHSIERSQNELLEVMEEIQKAAERKAEGFITELEKEIAKLKRRETELDELLHTENHLHVIQSYPSTTISTPLPTSDWTKININTNYNTETLRRTLLQFQQLVNKEIEKTSEIIVPELDIQRAEIKELLKSQLQKGDTWYLVDTHWFKQWKKYVGFNSNDTFSMGDLGTYPGPMDNSGLLKDLFCIKEHLIEELDYITIPTEGWLKLISWYGLADGQKPIARKVVEQGMFVKHCKVEVYLTELRLCEYMDKDKSISRSFSKADTVHSIEKDMRKLFNIPEKKETRLWCRYMSNTFEPLVRPEISIHEAGLFMGQTLVIEQKNKNGTWPIVEGKKENKPKV